MMTVSFFSFSIIGLYLENVLPSTYGLRKPFYFFLTKSYWFGERKNKPVKLDHSSSNDNERREFIEEKYIKPENFEPPSQDLRKQEGDRHILKIQDLKKTYSNGFQAVKGVSATMYNG